MPLLESAIVAIEILVALAAIVGLGIRGHWHSCYGFPAYLLCFAASEATILANPERFYVLTFWLAKEAVQAMIKLWIACEVGFRLFERLPLARRRVSTAILMILGMTGSSIAHLVGDTVPAVVGTAMPRLLYGTAAAFVVVVAAALWYHVPMRGIHKAILVGFSTYLVAFSAVLHLLESWGWSLRGAANWLNTAAFAAALVYWTVAAWRPHRQPDVPPEVSSWLPLWGAAKRA